MLFSKREKPYICTITVRHWAYWLKCCLPGRACDGSQPVQAEATGSQPGRPFAPGQLRLSRRSVAEGKMMRVIMECRDTRDRVTDFLTFALRLRKTPENLSQETVGGTYARFHQPSLSLQRFFKTLKFSLVQFCVSRNNVILNASLKFTLF